LNVPKLRAVKDADSKTIQKVEDAINKTLEIDYILSIPIEDYETSELALLGEYAKENNIFISLKSEHSNFHQGVLIGLIRRELANKFIEYL